MAIKKTAMPAARVPRSPHGLWSTPAVFVLASIGYVVGLEPAARSLGYHVTCERTFMTGRGEAALSVYRIDAPR